MNSDTVRMLTTAATVMVLFWVIGRIRRSADENNDGFKSLRYSSAYAGVGWIALIFFGGLLLFTSFGSNTKDKAMYCLAFGVFMLGGAFFVASARRCEISYNQSGVRCQPLFGQAFSFEWKDVTSVRFSAMGGWWTFRLSNGRKARVGFFMDGAREFIESARARVGVSIPSSGIY